MNKYLAYLPPSDLLSCTLVSSIWEREARKYLLKTVSTVPIPCSQVSHYFVTSRTRGQSHTHLQLTSCHKQTCVGTLVAKLRTKNCLQNVTSLSMPWTFDQDWRQDIRILSNFPNLITLELYPCLDGSKHELKVEEGPPAQLVNFTLPSVSTLVWHLNYNHQLFAALDRRENPALPALLQTLPEVKHLSFFGQFSTLLSQSLSLLPGVSHFSSVAIQENALFDDDENRLIFFHLLSRPQLLLSRLEFSLFKNYGSPKYLDEVLAKLAFTLEHLTIRGVRQVRPRQNNCISVVMPALPRLQVFEVFVTPIEYEERRVLELRLKFGMGRNKGLNYATQFPSLRRLEVKSEQSQVRDVALAESCRQFLYGSFLPSRRQEICTTLRILDVQTPRTEEEKFASSSLLTELYARIRATFPNLQNLPRYKP